MSLEPVTIKDDFGDTITVFGTARDFNMEIYEEGSFAAVSLGLEGTKTLHKLLTKALAEHRIYDD